MFVVLALQPRTGDLYFGDDAADMIGYLIVFAERAAAEKFAGGRYQILELAPAAG